MLDSLIDNFDIGYVIIFAMALAITLVTGPVFIPWLRKLKFGQQILEEGPSWHQKKSGTPTMGGLMFILGVLISCIVAVLVKFDEKLLIMLINQNLSWFSVRFRTCLVLTKTAVSRRRMNLYTLLIGI